MKKLFLSLLLVGLMITGCENGTNKNEDEFTLKINVTVPENTPDYFDLYLVGTMNDWTHAQEDWKLTKVDDTHYKFEKKIVWGEDTTYSIEYKVVLSNDWAFVEKGPSGEEISNRTLTVEKGGNSEFDITVESWAAIPPNPNDSDGEYSLVLIVNVPSNTPSEEKLYLIGSVTNNWDLESAWELTKVDETTYKLEKTLTSDEFVGNPIQYKIIRNKTYDNEEVQANDEGIENRKLTLVKDDTVNEEITVVKWKDLPLVEE